MADSGVAVGVGRSRAEEGWSKTPKVEEGTLGLVSQSMYICTAPGNIRLYDDGYY